MSNISSSGYSSINCFNGQKSDVANLVFISSSIKTFGIFLILSSCVTSSSVRKLNCCCVELVKNILYKPGGQSIVASSIEYGGGSTTDFLFLPLPNLGDAVFCLLPGLLFLFGDGLRLGDVPGVCLALFGAFDC